MSNDKTFESIKFIWTTGHIFRTTQRVRFPELTPRCASNHCKVPKKYLDVNSTKEFLESGETLRPEIVESIFLKESSKPLDFFGFELNLIFAT